MADELTTHVNRRGTKVITFNFKDDDDSGVTPNSATWTLADTHGTVINNRSAVSIANLTTANDIVVSGDDLDFNTGEEGTAERRVTCLWKYNSNAGSSLSGVDEVIFHIDSVVAVTTT